MSPYEFNEYAACRIRRTGFMECPARLGSLRLDVRLANDSAVFVMLFAKKSAEVRAARPNRIEPLGDELRLDLGYLHRRGEPVGQLGDSFLRCLRRRDYP